MFKPSKQRHGEEEKGFKQKIKLTKNNNMDWSEYGSYIKALALVASILINRAGKNS